MGKTRILLVDDDPSLNDVLSLTLGDAGYEVATAEDGSEALERLARPPLPDLIVSDINMPVVDGFTLLERVRERGVTIPVVLLTSRDG